VLAWCLVLVGKGTRHACIIQLCRKGSFSFVLDMRGGEEGMGEGGGEGESERVEE